MARIQVKFLFCFTILSRIRFLDIFIWAINAISLWHGSSPFGDDIGYIASVGCIINDKNAKGFIKPYENGYSFAALLPNEGVDINEFIQSLNGEKFLKIMEEAENADNMEMSGIFAALPKFRSETSIRMNEVLQKMGIKQEFGEKADFSKMEENSRKDVYYF